ncbi:glycosyltransferase [Microbulbifer thermotolerans]|uniref:glycosyltransferase n=1 Tax=Microbulbifer thermotolerans TaxID=252514 RepID=UPI00224B7194|nr:glycosyltransferase [Microbulbifer thermotolerans]MCX2780153.1 glycosyltransferase [Microbulbifer thermotolerans]MCX2805577.1 glycosyltransferase [Microbulbifer thermotolerans]
MKNILKNLTNELDNKNSSKNGSAVQIKGAIDKVEAGVIYGWAAVLGDETPIPVQVIAGEQIIGSGTADIFREDLENAGINNGAHGFEIPLQLQIREINSIQIKLIHGETLQEISHPDFELNAEELRVTADLVRVKDGCLIARLKSRQPVGARELSLYHENKLIFTRKVELSSEIMEVMLPIPASLRDGTPKLFKLAIGDCPDILAMDWFSIHPVATPWQYIRESYREPGFMSRPPQAGSRYEALQYHLDAQAESTEILAPKDLSTVHKVVVEGYEGRKKFPKFNLPKFDAPRVSIIVPAYNKFELTYHCIASIALAYNQVSYEVILADDCSTDDTAQAENIIGNLVVSRNPENLRFLRSCNRATDVARGDYIVFLNNDTEVTSFWLDELVNKLDSDQSIGLTGSKLLNLDGTLQEAGGIVWGNGEPWNVGRGENPYAPEYNYCREVDYLSGAAMCIRKSVWEEVGRFSEELAPCYYEDTDLAFKVRNAGYKTVYVPQSVVVHFEGLSHGRDVNKGLKHYQKVNEGVFRQKWFRDFRNNGRPSTEAVALEKDRNIDQRILVIDYASPMPNKDAGSYAAVQEIKLMLALGFKVTFVPENMAHFGKYTTELQRLGVEVLYAPFYTSVFDVLEKRLQEMSAVYITRYTVAEKYIDFIKQESNAKVIFNNADLHFLRELRAALKNGKNEEMLDNALQTRDKELMVCRQADAVLCYNSTEHAVITSHILESDKLHITPWVLEEKKPGPDFDDREGVAFLGGYNHHPNVEAVEYLAKEIMPRLYKKRPDICLYVYGSNMPESFKDYECDNIKMIGFAEHLDDVYHNHRVFVAPLLSGAGIKGKVLESMAYGLPAVLSEVAAESTGLTSGISTLIAEGPNTWVDAIIKLYDDHVLWKRFSENSKVLVQEKYSFEYGKRAFREIFSSAGIYSSNV